jgi:hypothetical protein
VRSAHRVVVGKPEGKNHLEDIGADGKILKGIFKNYDDERGRGLG